MDSKQGQLTETESESVCETAFSRTDVFNDTHDGHAFAGDTTLLTNQV